MAIDEGVMKVIADHAEKVKDLALNNGSTSLPRIRIAQIQGELAYMRELIDEVKSDHDFDRL
jgi:hypothetical protein